MYVVSVCCARGVGEFRGVLISAVGVGCAHLALSDLLS